jgi:large subunit ribosomal protein L18
MATNNSATRRLRRERRHLRVRRKISGTGERPRLVVFRSLNQIEGQVVDDSRGVTLVGLSTLAKDLREQKAEQAQTKTEASRAAGKRLAERAREMGITQVVFDRGGYI